MDNVLFVALKTDQKNIASRMQIILNAAAPSEIDGDASAWTKPVDEITANDFDNLAALMGEDCVRRMRIGDVVSE